eukprot:TRINITY_DN17570_c1_g1_i1.p1 TRINITY_DN17570_c1_g1~~TRINITY_DN17570_c1_g1_i1.p1  ORF type:complete len:148 (-),score=0.29 TRINITY_DN17570_c1_g1_i1:416-859(-)
MLAASKVFWSSSRSLSISFQGEWLSLPISKIKAPPPPALVYSSNTRRVTLERQRLGTHINYLIRHQLFLIHWLGIAIDHCFVLNGLYATKAHFYYAIFYTTQNQMYMISESQRYKLPCQRNNTPVLNLKFTVGINQIDLPFLSLNPP